MRHNSSFLALLFTCLGGCSLGTADVSVGGPASQGQSLCDHPPDSVCATQEADLIGGQHIDTGTVRIDNDGEHLLIEVTSEDGWQIDEVHIFAGTGDAPTNKKGTVVPGHFPYNTTYATPVTVHSIAIPLADLGVGCGDTLNTVVHAVVSRETSDGFEEQTAFGGGTPFTGTRWGFWSTFGICCDPPPPPPPSDDCTHDDDCYENPIEDCREPSSYWTAQDPAGWPTGEGDVLVCYSPSTGGITFGDAVAYPGTSAAFDALVDELTAALQNKLCYMYDCIIGPAVTEASLMLNDCTVDDNEAARAAELTALLASYNSGSYFTGEQCY